MCISGRFLGGWYAHSTLKGSEQFTQVTSYHLILKSLRQTDFLLQLPYTLYRHYQSIYIGPVIFDRNLWILSVFSILFSRTVVGCIFLKLYIKYNLILHIKYFKLYYMSNTVMMYVRLNNHRFYLAIITLYYILS